MKTITNFIDTEYLEYANYVLSSRAIPSLVDGFKPAQRKIMYVAAKSCMNRKIKTAALSGTVISDGNYHHGNTSLDGAISLMAAGWKQNAPLLKGEGNFGSRMVNEPAAARYTFVQIHKNFGEYFPDRDLVEYYKAKDPEDPEPKYFLPLIPWVLVSGIKGIAVGYATEIQPHAIIDLKRLCIAYLNGKNIRKMKVLPHYDSFRGKIFKDETGTYAQGLLTQKSATQVVISELPPGVERETYINILDKLEDTGKIMSYIDKCTDGKFNFEVKLRRGKKLTELQLIRLFKLTVKLNQNITTIDENGKLKIFKDVYGLIEHFCDWRLEQFQVRYSHYIHRDEKKLAVTELKIRYINDVNAGRVAFKDQTKAQLISSLVALKYNGDLEGLVSMPTYALTTDYKEKLCSQVAELKIDIREWMNINHNDQYIKEVKSL